MSYTYSKYLRALSRGLILLFVLPFGFLSQAYAVCATAKIEIDQDLAFERQAFEARMTINNSMPDVSLTDFSVTLLFKDGNGAAVVATTDTNATGAAFFYRVSSPDTMPTAIASGTAQTIKWLIIPAAQTGGTTSSGKLYTVGATVSYKLNGVAESVDLDPASITVKPMPKIAVEYFLPEQVIGDDPHTTDVTEPCEPFSLGVRVVNIGAGTAHSLMIDSGQPQIVDNVKHLQVRFQINSCAINGQATTPTLLANFGDLKPNAIGMGAWSMTASLTGKFTAFTATMTHADDLGGQVTTLLQSPTTYDLVGVVRVDFTGRDQLNDFLARERSDAGTLSIHESDQVETVAADGNLVPQPVSDLSGSSSISADGSKISVTCAVTGSSCGFVRVSDPWKGAKVISSVTRSDGKRIMLQNAWFSKTQGISDDDYAWRYFLNVFDTFPLPKNAGSLYYLVAYTAPAVNHAPVLANMAALILKVGGTNRTGTSGYQFVIRATDPDNDPIAITASNMPLGMSLTDQNNGTALLEWNPTEKQVGTYSVTLKAFDGQASDTKVLKVTVTKGSPIDDWKKKYFGDQTDPAVVGNLADPDGDGLSNLVEYALGLDPTKPDEEPILMGVTKVTGTDNQTRTYLTLTYVRRTGDASLSFKVLAKDSLRADGDWAEQTTLVPDVSQDSVPAGFERVMVRDSQAIEDGGQRRYMKLQVEIL